MKRRTLGIAAALIAVVALGVAGALALGGDNDGGARDVAAGTTTEPAEGGRTETEAPAEDEPNRDSPTTNEEEPQPAPEPEPGAAPAPAPEPNRYAPFSSSGGDWQAELPSGDGWRQPAEAALAGGRRIRITVRGPGQAVLLVDHTPSAAARFGSKYRSRRELSQPWFGSMTEYRLGDDAVGYVLNASESGPGFRVFATGVDAAVARRVADSLTYVDL